MEYSYKEKLVEYVFTQLQNGRMDFIYNNEEKIFGERKRQLIVGKRELMMWMKDNEDYTKEIISKLVDFQYLYGVCGDITDIEIEFGFDEFSSFSMIIKDFVEEKHFTYYEIDWDKDYKRIDEEMDRITNTLIEVLETSINDFLNLFDNLSEDECYSILTFGKNLFEDEKLEMVS